MGIKCNKWCLSGLGRKAIRMRILLLGANGQVGWELQRSLSPLGEVKVCDRQTIDLEELNNLSILLDEYKPEIIVNAAAYTAVDQAETDLDKAKRINTEAVSLLANKSKQLNAMLVHFSTDYVFDGTKVGAYKETNKVNPQSVYGETKLLGENAIIDSGCKHLVFRTSWVYAPRGSNFPKTIIRLASERDELKVVCDQFGVPTSAELIADVTSLCLYQIIQDKVKADDVTGIYNLTPNGKTSWHGLAQYVIKKALGLGNTFRITPVNILPISTEEYPLPAKRPANSLLNTQKIRQTFGIHLPHWEMHVDRLIEEIGLQRAQ